MSVILFGGCETGDLSEFTTKGGAVNSTTATVRPGGAYSLSANATKITITATAGPLYLRAWIYPTAYPSTQLNSFLGFMTGTTPCATFGITPSGSLATFLFGDSLTLLPGAGFVLPLNTWTMLEVTCNGGSPCSMAVRVNGALLKSYSVAGTFTTNTILFDSLNATTGSTFYDDWCLRNDQYPGPGTCIARQFKSGTPSYNAWTKTGAASIDLCWSNTPMSATTSAAATAASQAQTALVSSFSATQSGHGTGVMASTDVIQSVKVALFGKRASGSTTHVIRFLYGGSNIDSADWTAITTSDLYTEFYPAGTFNPTSLNNSEAGGVQGAASAFFTIEDVWVMADYAPAAAPLIANIVQLNQAFKRASSY